MTAATVRCLSVRRPWASLLLTGKDVENRSWSTAWRARLVIHAGRAVDRAADAVFPGHIAGTGYLGYVQLVDVHHASACRGRCSRWAEPNCWHWRVTDPRPFPRPTPGPGRLGLYTPPAAVLEATAQHLRGAVR